MIKRSFEHQTDIGGEFMAGGVRGAFFLRVQSLPLGARGLQTDRQGAVQKGEVEGRKARRLRQVAVAQGPVAKRALQPIDPPSFALEHANALVEVADAGKMRVEPLEIAFDSGIHRDGAEEEATEAIRCMGPRCGGGEHTMFFYHVNS